MYGIGARAKGQVFARRNGPAAHWQVVANALLVKRRREELNGLNATYPLRGYAGRMRAVNASGVQWY
jgi:hypothetical protein